MFFRFTDAACARTSFLFCGRILFRCVERPHFIYPLMGWWTLVLFLPSGCCGKCVGEHRYTCVWVPVFDYLGQEFLGRRACSLWPLRHCTLFSAAMVPPASPAAVQEGPGPQQPRQCWLLFRFTGCNYPSDYEVTSHCGVICIFLMTSDTKHCFICC